MGLISQLPMNVLIHTFSIEIASTIFVCYSLAVSLGHVPAWLPMISDCAVYSPEKYFFRWGMLLGAAAMAVQNILIYGADKAYSKSKWALFFSLLASFCLSILAVVNEAENNDVHSGKLCVCNVNDTNLKLHL